MNVLEKDRHLAEKLVNFGALCLLQARLELIHDHFDEAEKWAEEFLRCKRDLDELIRRKERHDELVKIVETLREKGIDIAVVARKGNE
ncbi:hypothetical protein GGR02_002901 [Anoxybacillus voinovskiensis]|uniref:Uncharacterized protein n=1 Tax=Anoxybacteroides voinovskiense TaxID=230470 RepID=A0A840E031_9BACL|nr:hypothetical protein [Anoxybacillus voinovskiensis]MBB4075099.1 hypothetical protein [Anoxybacillus voinovskiensis]GGJ76365.1 hypothetical protein GCM10008982_27040 [Anoxybacillus voinovskiensis]